MNVPGKLLLTISSAALLSGCRNDTRQSTEPAASLSSPAADMPAEPVEAVHLAEFRHQFPEGKENGNGASGSIRAVPVEGQTFHGFDDDDYVSETEYRGTTKSLRFELKLLAHRDGKDVYQVRRTVTVRVDSDGRVSESTGSAETVIVEYDGREQTAFDDEFGVASFRPLPDGAQNAATKNAATKNADSPQAPASGQ